MNFETAILLLEIMIFTLMLLIFRKGKRSKYERPVILFLIICITVTLIFAYNTDAEDMYISLRYVRNFIEGNGLVFNTYEKVEGYSDFLWILIISFITKLLHTDIPVTARSLGLLFSVLTILYCYKLTFEITENSLLSYLACFLAGTNSSFSCYGLSGMESPLFAFLILLFIHACIKQHWVYAGIIISLSVMTRPEGILLFFPSIIWILVQAQSNSQKFKNFLFLAASVAVLILPWMIWRVSYYGYFVPNAIAAKSGMDLLHQIKSGINYSYDFLIIVSNIMWILVLVPVITFLYKRKSFRNLQDNQKKLFILFLSTAFVYVLFYIYVGGDWMPGWRFYSSIVPLFSIIIVYFWNVFVFSENATLTIFQSALVVIIFVICGSAQVYTSFNNPSLMHASDLWHNQVSGLKEIGKWFQRTLPANYLIAAYPNGALSYYDKLPTIDLNGLTDEHIARAGKKKKKGTAGHVSHDIDYVLERKPDIIAITNGEGFEKEIGKKIEIPRDITELHLIS